LFALLKPYRGLTVAMILLTIVGNALNLLVPRIMARAVDGFGQPDFVLSTFVWQLALVAAAVFVLSYLQSIAQTYASEYVARDLRTRVAAKISTRSYVEVETHTPAKLLTNLTSDIDAVKLFVSQAVATIVASIFLIIGTSILLLSINWRLGLSVLCIVPFIGITFQVVLKRVRPLFKKAQEAIDALNRVISEHHRGFTGPLAQYTAVGIREVRQDQYGSQGHWARDAAPVCRDDSGDHAGCESGYGHHPVARRRVCDRWHHDAG
jgi:ATP-binding cassette subfamily B protein